MFQKMFPRTYGRKAFYIRIRPNSCFRVYKIEHLFSCVGEAQILEFFVSYRDLRKLTRLPFPKGTQSFGLDCPPDEGIKIMEALKRKGYCNLTRYFKGVR